MDLLWLRDVCAVLLEKRLFVKQTCFAVIIGYFFKMPSLEKYKHNTRKQF